MKGLSYKEVSLAMLTVTLASCATVQPKNSSFTPEINESVLVSDTEVVSSKQDVEISEAEFLEMARASVVDELTVEISARCEGLAKDSQFSRRVAGQLANGEKTGIQYLNEMIDMAREERIRQGVYDKVDSNVGFGFSVSEAGFDKTRERLRCPFDEADKYSPRDVQDRIREHLSRMKANQR